MYLTGPRPQKHPEPPTISAAKERQPKPTPLSAGHSKKETQFGAAYGVSTDG